MALRILTDSTSDFIKDEIKNLDISVVPLRVLFGTDEYRDGIDLTIDQFYEKLITSEVTPTTSQPTPNDFIEHFEAAKAANDDIIVILASKELSGTFQNANLAKNIVDYDRVYIVDTNNIAITNRLLVEIAVQLRKEGLSTEEIINKINELIPRATLIAALSTLEYLVKGGRLSKVAGAAGTLLSIKPIISLVEGKVSVVGKGRGKKAALESILKEIQKAGDIDFNYPVVLAYSHTTEFALDLQKYLKENGINVERLVAIGSTIGTHVGPGACGIAYIKK